MLDPQRNQSMFVRAHLGDELIQELCGTLFAGSATNNRHDKTLENAVPNTRLELGAAEAEAAAALCWSGSLLLVESTSKLVSNTFSGSSR